jgi:hypothetical protein
MVAASNIAGRLGSRLVSLKYWTTFVDPHATVFSVQHLVCFIRANTILGSHSGSLGASL